MTALKDELDIYVDGVCSGIAWTRGEHIDRLKEIADLPAYEMRLQLLNFIERLELVDKEVTK